jgi:transcriptional regulator with XRE-family HTH domain
MNINEKLLYKRIGQQIRQNREARGLTQEQLATAIGVLRTSVTNIEAGRQKAPLHLLYQLCEILQLEIKDILPPLIDIAEQNLTSIEIGGRLTEVPPRSAELINELLENPVIN